MKTDDVRFGSRADISQRNSHVRFTPESDAECVHSNVFIRRLQDQGRFEDLAR
jgi:hypothetical protein